MLDTDFLLLSQFQFNWERYFNKLTEGLGEDYSFSHSEEVFVTSPEYLKKLMKLLQKTQETQPG